MLIQFDKPAQHAEFKEFKDRHQIDCLLWSDEWVPGKDNVVVVDQKYERQAYEFFNNCRN